MLLQVRQPRHLEDVEGMATLMEKRLYVPLRTDGHSENKGSASGSEFELITRVSLVLAALQIKQVLATHGGKVRSEPRGDLSEDALDAVLEFVKRLVGTERRETIRVAV